LKDRKIEGISDICISLQIIILIIIKKQIIILKKGGKKRVKIAIQVLSVV